jgi:hypothetical protein
MITRGFEMAKLHTEARSQQKAVELYTPLPIYLHGTAFNYVTKHWDNFTFFTLLDFKK